MTFAAGVLFLQEYRIGGKIRTKPVFPDRFDVRFTLFFPMSAPTKNQKIEALVKLVQKKSRGAGLCVPPPRSVLETLMFAAVLENASFDRANEAYAVLTNYYIDWNEIRVCTVRELADTISMLPNPDAAAGRIRKSLQNLFEKTYVFDLEELRKKGKALAEHMKFLESIPAGSPYMIQYAAQTALDGHLFPMDEATLRIMRRLGLSQVSADGSQEICTGIERVVLKKSSVMFAMQLHHFAADFFNIPDSPELLALLSAIDPKAVERSWTAPVLVPAPVQKDSKPVSPPSPSSTPPKTATAAAAAPKPPVKASEKPAAEKTEATENTAKAAEENEETKVKEPITPKSAPKPVPKPKETAPPVKAETKSEPEPAAPKSAPKPVPKPKETIPPVKTETTSEPEPTAPKPPEKSPVNSPKPAKPESLSKTLRKAKPK
ncbi:MAG: hypothetical protein LBH00_01485 [Planctomycetaceae bacterium]|jgi:endonuclease-3|nr:hypothetical protein [Planctomycetaceae bacterium]